MDDNRATPVLYQGVYWIGVIAFAAMALGGLFYSVSKEGRPPGIALNYTDNIDALLKSRQFETAAEQMRMALMIESGGSFPRAQLELSLGNAMASHNAVPQAIQHFNRALEIDSEYAPAHYALGAVVAKQDPWTAEGHFLKAIELDEDYPAPYYGLGKLFQGSGQTAKSIEYFEKGLALFEKAPKKDQEKRNELEPDEVTFARVHNDVAVAKYNAGETQAALHHIKKALQLNDAYAEAHNNAAAIYMQLNEPRKALDHLKSAMRISPEVRDFRNNYEALMRTLQQGPKK